MKRSAIAILIDEAEYAKRADRIRKLCAADRAAVPGLLRELRKGMTEEARPARTKSGRRKA